MPRNRGRNLTLLAGLCSRGVLGELVVEGGVNGEVFVEYVRRVLAPELEPGQVVVLDNLGAHERAEVRSLIEARGCRLMFLPPYSPDLNPVELLFSKVKAVLRAIEARTKERLVDEIASALERVRPSDVTGWFRHCGFDLHPQPL